MHRFLAVLLLVVVGGCGERHDPDAGTSMNDASSDAATEDAPSAIDATSESVDAGEDASIDVGTDGGMDAGPPDGALTEGCSIEACNRLDDDCDGRIDEAGCGRCTSRVVRDRIYLVCPETVDGLDYAAGRCRAFGAGYEPVSIDDIDEQLSLTGVGRVWVGIHRRSTDGTFVKYDGTPMAAGLLTAPDFPADVAIARHCMTLSAEGELVDTRCGAEMLPFVCEAPIVLDCTPTTETCNGRDDDCDGDIDEESVCTGDCYAFRYADHTYVTCDVFQTRRRSTFDEARVACAAFGGDLVTFDSPDERAVVSRNVNIMISGFHWMGITDRAVEGTWLTVDGRSTEVGWLINEPDDEQDGSNVDIDCAAFTSAGLGFDSACSYRRSPVCERTPVAGP